MVDKLVWKGYGPQRQLALASICLFITNFKVIINLIFSGMLERWPRLNFVSVEGGIGWVPFLLEAMDYQWQETVPTEREGLTMKPSEYFRRQVYASFWFEDFGAAGDDRGDRRGQRDVRDRFPAPDLPVPEGAGAHHGGADGSGRGSAAQGAAGHGGADLPPAAAARIGHRQRRVGVGDRLAGKSAIVTGAASGMGAAEARLFAREGARVILADVLDDLGEAVAAEIRAAGGEALYARADVSAEADWEALIGIAEERHGGLDVLVNNAGLSSTSEADSASTEGWERIIAVNATGTFLGCKHGAAAMARSGRPGGSIVNISSIYGLVGSAGGHPAYHASKAAVRNLSKAMAVRLAPRGIRGELGASGLHAADAERGGAGGGGAGSAGAGDSAGADGRGGRGGERGAVPGVGRGVVRDGGGAGGWTAALRPSNETRRLLRDRGTSPRNLALCL